MKNIHRPNNLILIAANEQALCAVRSEDKDFREAKKFLSEWRMAVGAVLCARSERSGEWVHGTGAERLFVAMPCGAQRSMA
ncbi:MAG: hypothetical protein Sapg2KO_50260 [Saprospiraceae bacterium]